MNLHSKKEAVRRLNIELDSINEQIEALIEVRTQILIELRDYMVEYYKIQDKTARSSDIEDINHELD